MFAVVVGGLAGLLAAGAGYEQVARRRDRALPLPGRRISVDGSHLHLLDTGEGGPTVVVIAGAGDSSYSWLHVCQAVARFTRVIAYDRPGLGASDPGPAPDAAASVAQLHALLARAGAPGPFVLVGHSLGGLLARLYAIRYPNEVAGMVMVDSTHEFLAEDRQFRKGFAAIGILLRVMKAIAPTGIPRLLGDGLGVLPMYPEVRSYREQLTPAEYRQWKAAAYRNAAGSAGAAEFAATFPLLAEAVRQMKSGGEPQFGAMPLVVLTNPGYGQGWAEMHRELAGRSSRGVQRISDRKGHSVQMVRPELVITAIREVVEAVRSKER